MGKRIAVIGAGLIGQAWATSFAAAGHQVAIWDGNQGVVQTAQSKIAERLNALHENGLLDEEVSVVSDRIIAAATMQDAVADVDHVQENETEDLAIKRTVLETLDGLAPGRAVIASSTSALLPSVLFEGLTGAQRCLVAHPINPPYLIRAVELVGSPATTQETIDRCATLMKSAGHVVVHLEREVDGFVVNRLQGALLDEAFRLVENGIAKPDAIDAAIKEGLANRWVIMGPLETIDLNAPGGVRDYVERYGSMYERLAAGSEGRPNWANALPAIETHRRSKLPLDGLDERSRWRDEQLMKLRAHKRTSGLEYEDV